MQQLISTLPPLDHTMCAAEGTTWPVSGPLCRRSDRSPAPYKTCGMSHASQLAAPPASLGTQPPEHSVPATNTDSRHPERQQPAPTPSEPQAGRSGRSSSAPGPRSSVHSARTKQQPAAENAHIRSPKARDQMDRTMDVNTCRIVSPACPRPQTAHPRPTFGQRTRFSSLTCTPAEGPWTSPRQTALRRQNQAPAHDQS